LGAVIGIILSCMLLKIIQMLIYNTHSIMNFMINHNFFNILIDKNVNMEINIPFNFIIMAIIIIYIIVFILFLMPLREIEKNGTINCIKGKRVEKAKFNSERMLKIVKKLMHEEGELAYKTIKKDKEIYNSVVFSCVVSIVVFVVTSGFIVNLYFTKDNLKEKYNDYYISADYRAKDEIMNYLQENGCVDEYFVSKFLDFSMLVTKDKISSTMEKMLDDGIIEKRYFLENDKYRYTVKGVILLGDAYEKILQRAGITHLNENEVILLDSREIKKSKYGEQIKILDFELGDKVEVTTKNIPSFDRKIITIASTLKDFKPYDKYNEGSVYAMSYTAMILNDKLAEKILSMNRQVDIYISTNNPQKIDEKLDEIKKIAKDYGSEVICSNLYNEMKAIYSENLIVKIVLYTFAGLIVIFSVCNVFNNIFTVIIINKNNIAKLKGIGMSEKQINRMLMYEGIFYGNISAIYGGILSIILLFLLYKLMIDINLFVFQISWVNILISISLIYLIIFVAVLCAKRKIKRQNIIDEIRDENI